MSHMVIYRGVDGKPGYHQTDDIHDAVNFVEQMRNEEGVEHTRIFRLEEVVFEYRPYYRVELTDASAASTENGVDEPGDSSSKPPAQVGSGSGRRKEMDLGTDPTADDDPDDNGDIKVEAGGAKKGLFGR